MIFEKIPFDALDEVDLEWLTPVDMGKTDAKIMARNVANGNWDVRRLPEPAEGIAVTYPEDGLLFIYGLHGTKLFGSITKQDLLDAATAEGFSGIRCSTESRAAVRLYERLGFSVVRTDGPKQIMELHDGR